MFEVKKKLFNVWKSKDISDSDNMKFSKNSYRAIKLYMVLFVIDLGILKTQTESVKVNNYLFGISNPTKKKWT